MSAMPMGMFATGQRSPWTAASNRPAAPAVRAVRAVTSTPAGEERSPFAFDLLARPHIDELLDVVLQRAVTVLEAPAGYGKTAVLWQWSRAASRRGMTALHIKLNDAVRTPVELCAHLNEALAPAGISIEGDAWLGVDAATLILIDDYPLASSPELDETFGLLMRNIPAELHVAIASRAPVRWTLCKMLLKGRAQRFDATTLRFTQQEVAAYFASFKPSNEDLASVESIVQGWPAALHVLRLSHEHALNVKLGTLTETPPELAIRYVVEQVLEPVPENVLDLLVIAAALQRADAALLDAVRETDDSQELLQKAHECGVPVLTDDTSGALLCLHPFVAACLAREVTRLGESRRRQLHVRAHAWYLERSEADAAVHHAVQAGDPRKIFESIEAMDGVRLVMRDGATALERVFQQLPQQLLSEFPRAAVARSFLLAKSGRMREARSILQSVRVNEADSSVVSTRALDRLSVVQHFFAFIEDRSETKCDEEELRQQMDATGSFDPCMKLLLSVALSNARFRHGDLIGATDSALEAEFWSKEADVPYSTFFVYQRLGTLHHLRGRLHAAREYFERAAAIAAKLQTREPQLAILVDLLGSGVYLEQNDPAAAEMLNRSLPRIHQIECMVDAHISAHLIASRVEYARNGLAAALQVLTRAGEFGDRRRLPRLSFAMRIQRAELLLRSGRSQEAIAQLANSGVRMNGDTMEHPEWLSWVDRINTGLTLARALLANADARRSLKLSEEIAASCEAVDAQRLLLRCRLLQARCHHALDAHEQATAALNQALSIGAVEGASRPFIDEGEPMIDLLRSVVRSTGINQLPVEVVAFVAAIMGNQTQEKTELKPAGALLSPREYDVLSQLAIGHSNKLIARKLDLTENTVKFHLRSLYEKLGVGCRVLAVAVAKEKGILPE